MFRKVWILSLVLMIGIGMSGVASAGMNTPCDVSDVIRYINLWSQGDMSLSAVLAAIEAWENGWYCPDSYETDDAWGQAKWYTGGSSHDFHKPYDVDWIKFPASSGACYIITIVNEGGLSHFIASVRREDYLPDDVCNGGGRGNNCDLGFACYYDATYYIKVHNYYGDEYGSYDYRYRIEILPVYCPNPGPD